MYLLTRIKLASSRADTRIWTKWVFALGISADLVWTSNIYVRITCMLISYWIGRRVVPGGSHFEIVDTLVVINTLIENWIQYESFWANAPIEIKNVFEPYLFQKIGKRWFTKAIRM